MHIIPLSSVKKSFTSAPCISSRCHQDSIFQQCHHAHHLAVSLQHLSSALICTSSRYPQYSIFHQCYRAHNLAALSTASFSSAIMHIIMLSSAQHLSSMLLRPSSRCPQHSNLSSVLSCT
mmetsp:Transcript_3989/g.6069  ORF Transcript_3989/g.6069 Transcript_3989/m.6069 type:complete len:120 (-) Transcript_3989:37-396(-)